ncbi:hypothetical protein PPYR_05999 [Photinus pyralis]|uniref:Pupal cuticle protein Edg-84A n=1 Tax=Photinus pyralis TaxID=7054 RepID=A0A5N4ASQ9_PHOPY|nr:larval cuticle protein A2B-like [Photinus pyralis]XP_031338191.1 larval cuticle protein A2B-like [Photinus pyralis]KAB0800258.1 hypothetical protein PPYR_05998 [Photinus pyralis]KAB0800259.1 hypothetical protein PPYR_05999 [Photinus pyralis]
MIVKNVNSSTMIGKSLFLVALIGLASASVIEPVITETLLSAEFDPHPQYAYSYGVNDPLTGDVKSQVESRDGGFVKGQYTLDEPDGTKRIVDYTADDVNGFNAVVQKVPLARTVVSVPAPAAAVAVAAPSVTVAAPASSIITSAAPVVSSISGALTQHYPYTGHYGYSHYGYPAGYSYGYPYGYSYGHYPYLHGYTHAYGYGHPYGHALW